VKTFLKQLGPVRLSLVCLGGGGILMALVSGFFLLVQGKGWEWPQWWALTFGLMAIALGLVSRFSRPVISVYGVVGLGVFLLSYLADVLGIGGGGALGWKQRMGMIGGLWLIIFGFWLERIARVE